LVAAAVSLGPALQKLVRAFERSRPGVRVRVHLAASGTLVAQMKQGLAADVLATADTATMGRAQGLGLVHPDTVEVFAGNRLWLVGRQPAPSPGLQALKDRRVRFIALGEPQAVPLGRYARQALQARGLWEAVSPKAVYADSALQALSYAARGEADAAVVYASDVRALGARAPGEVVQFWAELPSPEPVRYAAARANQARWHQAPAQGHGPSEALASAFLAFLQSPAARALLQGEGLTVPPFEPMS
jgi:molybdate transport system substrate-binding protein